MKIEITGDNAASYQSEVTKAANKFIQEYKDEAGAENVEIQRVRVAEVDSKVIFNVLGIVDGYQSFFRYKLEDLN